MAKGCCPACGCNLPSQPVKPQFERISTALPQEGRHPARQVDWPFRVSGEGPLVLLACHGFSQGPEYFDALAAPLRGVAQVWAVALPAHGPCNWPGERPCRPQQLVDLLGALRARSGAAALAVIGFSMGGRYAMVLGQAGASELHSLHLAAPEGLSPNWPQIISTDTAWGRYLIKRQIERPGFITTPVRWLERSGLLSKKMADFARANIASRELRVQLRESWIAMSGLKPDHAQLAAQAGRHGLPVHLYAGRRDPLISLDNARKLSQRIPGGALHVLDKGHFLIDAAFGERMAGLLSAEARP
jgi:pimeloyl-ACP methyl ester carboxylesterase